MTFAEIFVPICSLDELVVYSHHQSKETGILFRLQLELTDFTENRIVDDGHRL